MIILVGRASPEQTPPATTPGTIEAHADELGEAMTALLDGMIPIVERVSGVLPMRISVAIEWVDGTERKSGPPAPDTKVPSWMS